MLNLPPAFSRILRLGVTFFGPFGVAAVVLAVALPAYLSLVWFSFYTAITNLFIPWLPHEPMVLLYGALFAPWLVALLGGIATCWVEFFNYPLLRLALSVRPIREITKKKSYQVAERWFNKSPFLVLVFAGVSPLPYAPFRVFSVRSGYPLGRYLLAVFVARTPRYYVLALAGEAINLPLWAYGIVFGLLVGIVSWRWMMGLRRKSLERQEAVQGPS